MLTFNKNRSRFSDVNVVLSILLLFVLEANSCEVRSIRDNLRSIRSTPQCSALSKEARFDCNPDKPITKDICSARGCCWNPEKGEHLRELMKLVGTFGFKDFSFIQALHFLLGIGLLEFHRATSRQISKDTSF